MSLDFYNNFTSYNSLTLEMQFKGFFILYPHINNIYYYW